MAGRCRPSVARLPNLSRECKNLLEGFICHLPPLIGYLEYGKTNLLYHVAVLLFCGDEDSSTVVDSDTRRKTGRDDYESPLLPSSEGRLNSQPGFPFKARPAVIKPHRGGPTTFRGGD
jgi:hypothetical protein